MVLESKCISIGIGVVSKSWKMYPALGRLGGTVRVDWAGADGGIWVRSRSGRYYEQNLSQPDVSIACEQSQRIKKE